MSYRIKDYNQNQNWLFPPSIQELIPQDHSVRIVNSVIEQIDIKPLLDTYSKEGHPSYHPKMMLKVIIYAYMDNIYSNQTYRKWFCKISILCGSRADKLLTVITSLVFAATNSSCFSKIFPYKSCCYWRHRDLSISNEFTQAVPR